MIKYALYVFIGLVLMGCGNDPGTVVPEIGAEEAVSSMDDSKYDLLDLSEFGLPAKIHVPNRSFTNMDPKVELNETSGVIEVSSGNKFKLKITESEIDKALLKSDLKDDLLFTNTITKEEEDLIVYSAALPDGSGEYEHFCAWLTVNGTMFMIQNDGQEKFSSHYLDRMINCVKSMQINSSI